MTLVSAATDSLSSIRIPALGIQLIVGLIIPFITGLLTKINASATVKQVVTIVLSGVSALIVASTVGEEAVISWETLGYAALGWLVAVLSYLGLYAPHNVNAKLAPDKGLG
jgi:hypothetical protein